MEKMYVSVREACATLSVGRSHLYELMNAGTVESIIHRVWTGLGPFSRQNRPPRLSPFGSLPMILLGLRGTASFQ